MTEIVARTTYYPPALNAHDRAVWDLKIAAHTSCMWTYRRHPELPVTIKRCWCGAVELAPAVSACPVRVTATATVIDGARPRALPPHPLALPAAPMPTDLVVASAYRT